MLLRYIKIKKIMQNKFLIILCSLVTLAISGCTSSDDRAEKKDKHAFLIFSSSANNLQSDLWDDINDIKKYYKIGDAKHLYAFHKFQGKEPVLYRIRKVDGVESLVEVKRYPAEMHCASVESLEEVMRDVEELDDVREIQDVLLSSHGSAWLPVGASIPILSNGSSYFSLQASAATVSIVADIEPSVSQASFGQDYADYDIAMDIKELAKTLEKFNLNTLIFDACYMCNIETLYQLRNSAEIIISSPAEIISGGMNYIDSAPLYTNDIGLNEAGLIAYHSYEKYASYSPGFTQSATFTVTDTRYLEELANFTKNIFAKYRSMFKIEEDNAYRQIVIPSMFYDDSRGYLHDIKMYLINIIEEAGGTELSELEEIWNKAFPYFYATDMLFNVISVPEVAGGVGGYIYGSNYGKSAVIEYYTTLDWAKAVEADDNLK